MRQHNRQHVVQQHAYSGASGHGQQPSSQSHQPATFQSPHGVSSAPDQGNSAQQPHGALQMGNPFAAGQQHTVTTTTTTRTENNSSQQNPISERQTPAPARSAATLQSGINIRRRRDFPDFPGLLSDEELGAINERNDRLRRNNISALFRGESRSLARPSLHRRHSSEDDLLLVALAQGQAGDRRDRIRLRQLRTESRTCRASREAFHDEIIGRLNLVTYFGCDLPCMRVQGGYLCTFYTPFVSDEEIDRFIDDPMAVGYSDRVYPAMGGCQDWE